jgi:hypothetical protein
MTEILRHRFAGYGKDRTPVAKFLIDYKDIFSFAYLYKLMHEWLVEEGYAAREDSEFPEVFYLQRETPHGGEYWIRWRTMKKPYSTSLWRYALDIDMHAYMMKKAELILAGKKYEVDKGEIEIEVQGNLIVDPDKKIENLPFNKLLGFKPLLVKWLLRKRFEDHKNTLYKDVYRFQDAIKTYLKLETYLPEKELSEYWMKKPGSS